MNELKLYHTYTDKFDQTKRIWGYQIRDLNEKYGHGNWRNLRVPNSRYGGQIGYSYQIINETLPVNAEKPFVRFIRPTSVGLNSLGQTFLIQSIEAFCYSILGAQADPRFSIVNQGAKSMQTQAVSRQLVNSSIVQNNNTIMLNNFRTSVKDTNVVLNQNVSPGLLIIQSSLIILEHPIPGYNDYLTTSSVDMRFGTNTGLNKFEKIKGADNSPRQQNGGSRNTTPKNYSHYSGQLLGATAYDDKSRKEDNSIFWTVLTLLTGLVVFEVVISNDGFHFKAQSKSKK